MSPCRLADRCHRFRQACSLHLQGGHQATGHPTKCHIHDTSDRDKVKCHMCAQIPGDYILFAGVNTFRITAAAYPLTLKKKKVFLLTCNQHSEVHRSLHNCGPSLSMELAGNHICGFYIWRWLIDILVSLWTPWISLFKNTYGHRHLALKRIEVVHINTHTHTTERPI